MPRSVLVGRFPVGPVSENPVSRELAHRDMAYKLACVKQRENKSCFHQTWNRMPFALPNSWYSPHT